MYRSSARRALAVLAAVTALLGTAASPSAAGPPFVVNQYFDVINQRSNQCLDVKDVSTSPGAAIQQWPCWGGANQTWKPLAWFTSNGDPRLVVGHSQQCLAALGGLARQDVCNTADPYQRWYLQPVDATYYRIRDQTTNRCLDVQDMSTLAGAQIQLWDCWDTPNQLWQIRYRPI